MRKWLIFLILPFIGSAIFGDGLPTTYLVYVPSFTALALNTSKGYGYQTNQQPSKMTNVVLPPNTNYLEISYTTRTPTENTAVLALISQGKIKPERRIEFITDSRGSSDIRVTDCFSDPVNFICRPSDYDRNWTTWVSSP